MFSKKFLSSVMAAALTLSMTASFVKADTGYTDVKDADAYASSVVRLAGLGIMQGDGTGKFNPDANFTRAEAAKVLVTSLGYKVTGSAASVFTDVAKDKWYAGVVNVANRFGLVTGYTKGGKTVFGPEDNVTYGQLATMVVRSLGYKDDDLDGTTWPYNYIAKASELGLLNDIESVDADAPAKRSDVAIIASAMMDVPTKTEAEKPDVYRADGTVIAKKTLLDTVIGKLGLKTVTGMVYATNAEDNTVAAGKVDIGGTQYDLGSTGNIENYRGQNVTAYVTKKNAIASIKGYASNNGAAGTVKTATVSDDSGNVTLDSTNNVKIVADSTKILTYFNGVKKSTTTSFVVPKDASVTAVDQNNDGKYDVAYATKADMGTYRVDSVDATNKLIKVKNLDGSAAASDVRYIDAAVVTGDVTKVADLKAGDCVTFTQDIGAGTTAPTVQAIKVTRKSVVGKITQKAQDNSWIYVGTTKYDVTNKSAVSDDAFTKDFTFVLGSDGKVVASFDAATGSLAPVSTTTVSAAAYGIFEGCYKTTATSGTGLATSSVDTYNYVFLNGKGAEVTYKSTLSNIVPAYTLGVKDTQGLYGQITLDSSDSTKITKFDTTVPALGSYNDMLVPDDAVVVQKKLNTDNTLDKYEVITGKDYKTKYKAATPAKYLVGSTGTGFNPVVFVYFNTPLAVNTTSETNYTLFNTKASAAIVGKDSDNNNIYQVGAIVNGTAKTLKLKKAAYDALADKTYTISNNVTFDGADATLVTALVKLNGGTTVTTSYTQAVDATKMLVTPSKDSVASTVYGFASDAKVFVLGTDGNPAVKAVADITSGMDVDYILDGTSVKAIVASKKVTVTMTLGGYKLNVILPANTNLDTDSVYLCGDFSGFKSWGDAIGQDAYKLKKQADGTYAVDTALPLPGSNGFKFVKNDSSHWQVDPNLKIDTTKDKATAQDIIVPGWQ